MAISVFPERMNALNRDDPAMALGTVETYIHYMCERVEFALSGFFRQIGEYGTSAAGTALILADLDNGINELTAEQTALGQALGGKAGREELEALAGTVEALSRALADVRAAADGLEARLAALEEA